MPIMCDLACIVSEQKNNSINISQSSKVMSNYFNCNDFDARSCLKQLFSEQILTNDLENEDSFRFKHSKFIEYLVALHLCNELNKHDSAEVLENLSEQFSVGVFLGAYHVHSFVKAIIKSSFPKIEKKLNSYYAKTDTYMSQVISHYRLELCTGNPTSVDDIESIFKNCLSGNSENSWNAFFVLVAKPNNFASEKLKEAFHAAFEKNSSNNDRYKLIYKACRTDLIFSEVLWNALTVSSCSKCWYTLLDYINEEQKDNELLEFTTENFGVDLANYINCENDYETTRVKNYLNILLSGKYIKLGSEEIIIENG